MKYLSLYENFIQENPKGKLLAEGTEAVVYTDGIYAYRYAHDEGNYYVREFSHYIGKNYENVVKIYDIYKSGNDSVVKMELLEELDLSDIDREEYEYADDELNNMRDEVIFIPDLVKNIKDPKLKIMVDSIYKASQQLGLETMDIGFHNLMFDPISKNYKQIDLF